MLTLLMLALLQVPAEPTEKGWIYWLVSPEKLTAGQVTVFSVCLDDTPCQHVTPEASAVPAFPHWYRWKLPAVLVGKHTASVQLCNMETCGAAVVEPFTVSIQPEPADKVIVR